MSIRFPLMLLSAAILSSIVFLLVPFPYKIRIFVGKRLVSYWAKSCCIIYNLKITIVGDKPKVPAGTLVIANHLGYWDIFILASLFPSVFLSKSEVIRLPIIGQGAWAAGVLFVDRSSATSGAKSIRKIAKGITEGATIIAFPEGTTTKEEKIRDFKLGTFKSAVLADIPIQPVAFTMTDFYEEGWHEENMLRHYFRRGGKWKHHTFVAFGNVIRGAGDDAAKVRDKTHTEIVKAFDRATEYKREHFPENT